MAVVNVYRFCKYDINRGENVVSRHMASRETIRKLGREFQVVEDTAVEVDSSRLNGNGMILADALSPRK